MIYNLLMVIVSLIELGELFSNRMSDEHRDIFFMTWKTSHLNIKILNCYTCKVSLLFYNHTLAVWSALQQNISDDKSYCMTRYTCHIKKLNTFEYYTSFEISDELLYITFKRYSIHKNIWSKTSNAQKLLCFKWHVSIV